MTPGNVCVFWDSASPPYIRVARPTAATLSGQLLKIRTRIRLTAAPGRPRDDTTSSSTAARIARRVLGRRPVGRGVAARPGWPAGPRRWPGWRGRLGRARGEACDGLAGGPAARRADRARAGAATDPPGRDPARRPPAEGATAAAGRVEQPLDRPRQPGLGQVAHDPGALDEADLAVLLGDDDDHRVGLLGDAEGGAVARPEALGVDRGLGQRQERPGGDDPVVADDHRAIVERRLRA